MPATRSIRKFSSEAWIRIRMQALAKRVNVQTYLEDNLLKILEFIDVDSPDFSRAADHVVGLKIYPLRLDSDSETTANFLISDRRVEELLKKIAAEATGSVESFLLKALTEMAKRIPPSKSMISKEKGDRKNAKLDLEGWDGSVDVAQAEAEGNRLK